MEELWKSLKELGYPGYWISNLGRVKGPRTIRTGSPMGQGGYLVVDLYANKQRKNWAIHRLVALAFVYNPKPEEFDQVNHKDTDKCNNRADNLEWTSSSGNRVHAYATGTQPKGDRHYNAKLTDIQVQWIRDHYIPRDPEFGQNPLARKFDVGQNTIWTIVHNRGRL